jgi:hypothetical protein
MKVKDWPPTDDFGREMPRHYMVGCSFCYTCRWSHAVGVLLEQLVPAVLQYTNGALVLV